MLELMQSLIDGSVKRKFQEGSTILYQGEVPRAVNILLTGSVRVMAISETGGELTVAYHIAGEFFPSSWIFGKSPSTLFFYEAKEDCEVAYIDRHSFLRFMKQHPELYESMFDYFTTNYCVSLIRTHGLQQPKAKNKLVYALYFLCERYGVEDSEDIIRLPLPLTHQDFADLVGLTRETTAIEMGKLKKSGILSYEKQIYYVKRTKLEELVGEDSFKGLNIKSDKYA